MPENSQFTAVQNWYDRRTFGPFKPDAGLLHEQKSDAGLSITVCLPALNEEATVGAICASVKKHLMDEVPLVDQLLLVDSGSEDLTRERAAEAGATVYRAAEILPHLGDIRGKGEALWKSLAVAEGDIIVWVDSDVTNFEPSFVTNLVTPLLLDPEIVYVKGFYHRPVEKEGGPPQVGGRVTELVVRPMLHLLYPPLTGLVQPLSGEYAGRREALLDLPFFTGYAVEICHLIDIVERHGLDRLAQVDLGVRIHHNQDTLALGKMAHQIMQAFLGRLEATGRIKLLEPLPEMLVQFVPGVAGPVPQPSSPAHVQRPPMSSVL